MVRGAKVGLNNGSVSLFRPLRGFLDLFKYILVHEISSKPTDLLRKTKGDLNRLKKRWQLTVKSR